MRNKFHSILCIAPLFVYLLFAGCQPDVEQTKGKTLMIQIDKSATYTLQEVTKSVELIPLETGSDCLIGSIRQLIYVQNRFYIRDRLQNQVFVFSDSGQCIGKIANFGEGPGQYESMGAINPNPYTGGVDILEYPNIIHRYDKYFNYVDEVTIPLPNAVPTFHDVNYIDEEHIALYQFSAPNTGTLFCYSLSEKRYTGEFLPNRDTISKYRFGQLKELFRADDRLWHLHLPTSTLYEITPNSLLPSLVFDFGKRHFDYEEFLANQEPGTMLQQVADTDIIHPMNYFGWNRQTIYAQIGGKRTLLMADEAGHFRIVEGLPNDNPNYPLWAGFHDEQDQVDFHLGILYEDSPSLASVRAVLTTEQDQLLDERLDERNENPILIKYYFKDMRNK